MVVIGLLTIGFVIAKAVTGRPARLRNREVTVPTCYTLARFLQISRAKLVVSPTRNPAVAREDAAAKTAKSVIVVRLVNIILTSYCVLKPARSMMLSRRHFQFHCGVNGRPRDFRPRIRWTNDTGVFGPDRTDHLRIHRDACRRDPLHQNTHGRRCCHRTRP